MATNIEIKNAKPKNNDYSINVNTELSPWSKQQEANCGDSNTRFQKNAVRSRLVSIRKFP
jgi:hypothetical protein